MVGEEPYADTKAKHQVILKVCRDGSRPARPVEAAGQLALQRGLNDRLWGLLTDCWRCDRNQRPDICEVLERIPKTRGV